MGDVSNFKWCIAYLTHPLEQYLFSKGIIKQGGSRPLPAEVVDPLGNCKSWESLWGGLSLFISLSQMAGHYLAGTSS